MVSGAYGARRGRVPGSLPLARTRKRAARAGDRGRLPPPRSALPDSPRWSSRSTGRRSTASARTSGERGHAHRVGVVDGVRGGCRAGRARAARRGARAHRGRGAAAPGPRLLPADAAARAGARGGRGGVGSPARRGHAQPDGLRGAVHRPALHRRRRRARARGRRRTASGGRVGIASASARPRVGGPRVEGVGGFLRRLLSGDPAPTPMAPADEPDAGAADAVPPSPRPGDTSVAESLACEPVWEFARRHPDLGVRVYRTAAGLRVLVTGASAPPASDRARELLTELGSDPLYVELCSTHDSYRARLTPKPFRVGERALSVSWPFAGRRGAGGATRSGSRSTTRGPRACGLPADQRLGAGARAGRAAARRSP